MTARRRGPLAMALVLAGLAALAGCSTRTVPVLAGVDLTQVPHSAPTPPSPPAIRSGPDSASGSPTAVPEAATAPAPAPAPASKTMPRESPAATQSAYVFSPQQAVSAGSPPSPQGNALPELQKPDSEPSPKTTAPTASAPSARGVLKLAVVASAREIGAGEIVTVDVMASSDTWVVDAPLHLRFDPNVMAFLDGAPGDFLTQGGSSVVFLADGLSRPGDVAVAAGRVERSQGATGAGLLCRVRLKGTAEGTSAVIVGQAKAWGTHGEELDIQPSGTAVSVHLGDPGGG